MSPTRPGAVNVMTESFVAILLSTVISALVGTMVAYVALVLAGMSADVANRGSGVVVAFCVTFAMSFVVISSWALLVAAYGAIVAWFRLPRIVG